MKDDSKASFDFTQANLVLLGISTKTQNSYVDEKQDKEKEVVYLLSLVSNLSIKEYLLD